MPDSKYSLSNFSVFPVSIIIGIVLFIGYTFQYLGPVGKIAIGYLVALALFGSGWFLVKKYKSYADSLLAIGWAIAYFTTFATHYITASRIIENVNLNLFLLFIVSGGLAIFSYFYKSERFSVMAILLGAISAIISPTPFLSLIAILVLILYAVSLAIVKNWAVFGFSSAVVSYVTYFISLDRQGYFYSLGIFKLGAIFLTIYFLLFVIASLFMKPGMFKEDKYAASLISFNSFAFFMLFLSQLYHFYPEQDGIFTTIFGLALLLIALVNYLFFKEKKYIWSTYGWLGWGFLTLAIPLQLTGTWIAGVWLAEGAALLVVGLINNRQSFISKGAITVGLFLVHFLGYDIWKENTVDIFGLAVKSRVIFIIFTTFVFTAVSLVWEKARRLLSEQLSLLIFLPWLAVTLTVMLGFVLDINRYVLSVAFLSEGFIIYLIGLLANRQHLRLIALLPLSCFALRWFGFDFFYLKDVSLGLFGNLTYLTANSVIAIIIFYFLYAASQFDSKLGEEEKSIVDFFALGASIILILLTFIKGNDRLISVSWTAEAGLILTAGFIFKKRILRLTGIAILLFAILRVFIIDLSFLETIYRIISFIILGGILMAVSFLYTKYKDKIL